MRLKPRSRRPASPGVPGRAPDLARRRRQDGRRGGERPTRDPRRPRDLQERRRHGRRLRKPRGDALEVRLLRGCFLARRRRLELLGRGIRRRRGPAGGRPRARDPLR